MDRSNDRRNRGRVILKWVAGASAILTLVFGIQRVAGWLGDYQEHRHRIDTMLATAATQLETGSYRHAWRTLDDAARLGARERAVRLAREDLAMEWLRNLVAIGDETLTQVVDTVMPVLEWGVTFSSGGRQADLMAHVGWADQLRYGDGRFWLDPDLAYRRALQVDPTNVYAHAMRGHWLLGGGAVEAAQAHFRAALATDRAHPFARKLQWSALGLAGDDGEAERFRVGNEMRIAGDSLGFQERFDLLVWHCVGFRPETRLRDLDPDRPADRLILPPAAEAATLRWLADGMTLPEVQAVRLEHCQALLDAVQGRRAEALETLRALRDSLPWDARERQEIERSIEQLERATPPDQP